jgi:hypothetical protein
MPGISFFGHVAAETRMSMPPRVACDGDILSAVGLPIAYDASSGGKDGKEKTEAASTRGWDSARQA